MEIESDPIKATSNLVKHGVSFEEAATALYDSQEKSLGVSRYE